MKSWEIIADNLSKAGWSLGCISAIDSNGQTIWIADGHRDDCQRFIVRAEEKLAALIELESARKKTGDKERLTAAVRPLNLELEPALVGVEARFCRRNGVIYLLHNRA